MKVYGLTGGIGMGKSMSEKLLAAAKISVIDMDTVSRRLVEPGQPALQEIKNAFGDGVVGFDGRLRRPELAALVFNDDAARQKLEAILHPKIRSVWKKQIADWHTEGKSRAVVVIPLLFETEAAASFDEIICVACAATTQNVRLQERGWNQTQIGQRIAAQWQVEKKMALSQRVVWTEGSVDAHREQLEKIFG